MERQVQCISSLVDDMLDISRIEHGKIKLPLNLWISRKPLPERSKRSVPQSRHTTTSWKSTCPSSL